jgi:hypothetical protein
MNLRTLYLDDFKKLVIEGQYASIEHKTLDGSVYRIRFTKEALLHLLLKLCRPDDPRPEWPYVQDPAQSDRFGHSYPYTISSNDCCVTLIGDRGTPVAEVVCPKVAKISIRIEPSCFECMGEHITLIDRGKVCINKLDGQKCLDFINAEEPEEECDMRDLVSQLIEQLNYSIEKLELRLAKEPQTTKHDPDPVG